MKNFSFHNVFEPSPLEALKYAKANGFQGIQIAVESPHLSFEAFTEREIESIHEFCSENNLYVTIHAPDNTAPLVVSSKALWSGIRNYYRLLFSFARKVNARVVTLHIGKPVAFGTAEEPMKLFPEEDLPFYAQALREHLRELLKMIPEGTVVAVENCGFSRDMFNVLGEYFDRTKLGLCWDIAKSSPDTDRFYQENIEYVRQFHLHDYKIINGAKKGHQVLGDGVIDIEKHMEISEHADVLDYCIEVRPKEKALESLKNLRKILAVPPDDPDLA